MENAKKDRQKVSDRNCAAATRRLSGQLTNSSEKFGAHASSVTAGHPLFSARFRARSPGPPAEPFHFFRSGRGALIPSGISYRRFSFLCHFFFYRRTATPRALPTHDSIGDRFPRREPTAPFVKTRSFSFRELAVSRPGDRISDNRFEAFRRQRATPFRQAGPRLVHRSRSALVRPATTSPAHSSRLPTLQPTPTPV